MIFTIKINQQKQIQINLGFNLYIHKLCSDTLEIRNDVNNKHEQYIRMCNHILNFTWFDVKNV